MISMKRLTLKRIINLFWSWVEFIWRQLQYIGETAFAFSGLTSINVPNGCVVDDGAFQRCKNLVTAVFGEGSSEFKVYGSILYNFKNINFT